MSTTEENTRWIEVWILNDPEEYLHDAIRAAEDSPEALRAFIENVLSDAPAESTAWYTAREMAASDYDSVDWAEVASTILSD